MFQYNLTIYYKTVIIENHIILKQTIKENPMTITVTNNSEYIIKTAINQWGNDGDTNFFEIKIGESEEWNRSSGVYEGERNIESNTGNNDYRRGNFRVGCHGI